MNGSEQREREAMTSSVDDIAEMGGRLIEMLNDSKTWEHVPIAKWGVSTFRIIQCVRDKILDNKIKAFVQGAGKSLSAWEIADTISRLGKNPQYAESVGEHLIEHLDRLDGRRKALMSAAVFAAFAGKRVLEEELYRLMRAIEIVHVLDLAALRNLTEEGPLLISAGQRVRKFTPDQESLQSLAAASLVHSHTTSQIGGNTAIWNLTNLGNKFLELRLDLIPYREDSI